MAVLGSGGERRSGLVGHVLWWSRRSRCGQVVALEAVGEDEIV